MCVHIYTSNLYIYIYISNLIYIYGTLLIYMHTYIIYICIYLVYMYKSGRDRGAPEVVFRVEGLVFWYLDKIAVLRAGAPWGHWSQ